LAKHRYFLAPLDTGVLGPWHTAAFLLAFDQANLTGAYGIDHSVPKNHFSIFSGDEGR
jgi:hypothetical protein